MSAPLSHPFLRASDTMAPLVAGFDWPGSGFGPPSTWPQHLRTVVAMLFDSSQPMRLAWGPRRLVLYNDAYASMLGKRHPAAFGQPLATIWPDLWDTVSPILDRVFAGFDHHESDGSYSTERNGYPEQMHVAFTYLPVRGDQGQVDGVLCICNETTTQVHAARAQSAESDRLHSLFDQAPSFMAMLRGPEHRFELANAAYQRVVGRDPRGLTLREALPDLVGQGFHELLDQVQRTGVPYVGTGVTVDFATQRRVLNFVYQPIREADGSVSGIFVEGHDVTAEHQAAETLRQLAGNLEQRVDERSRELAHWWKSAPYLKAVADAELRIQALNPAWGQLLGHGQALIGQPFMALVHPEDAAAAQRALRSITSEAHASVPLRMRHKDGGWRHISWIVSLEPETRRYYAMGRDLSEERATAEALANAEAQLRQSQKMEAIGQLTGGIAHDFNNMLQGIVMPLQLIQRKARAGDAAEVERYVASGLASAQRAAALTQRLLAFSRRQPLDSRPTDIVHALSDLEPMLAGTLGENIRLTLDVQAELWPATTDLHQFENAVLNLAINARDAMPDGGELSIVAENVCLTPKAVAGVQGLPAGDYVRVLVRDTGVGMPADVLLKAFDPFFTTKPLGQGTGLGLSMIYGYARQSGGYVALDSEAGVGTVVRLYLPRSEAGQVPQRQPGYAELAAAEGHGARPESVLVVEDDDTVRQLVAELLRSHGLQVMEASTGNEGMQLLSGALRFDLLLTDVGLPGPNGRQLADYAQERLPGIRIVLMTGYAEQAFMRAQFLGDTMELLVKPFDTEQLLAKVQNALARPSFAAAANVNPP